MCGISGILDLNQNVKISTLINMTQIIKHRGPDDEGYQLFGYQNDYICHGDDTIDAIKNNTYNIHDISSLGIYLGFGHRRLSILDVNATGHQPMNLDNYTITYNGEIYNYIELRKKLEKKGYSFNTQTDTEVILYSYKEWGEECVNYFNGMWAFVIYDKKKNKLFCSRDRFGVKPFYYFFSKEDNKFLFSSEIKQIIQEPSIKKVMNEKILGTNLIYGFTDYNNETLIKDIYQLEGGYNLLITFDINEKKIISKKKKQYWDLKINRDNKLNKNYSEAIGKSLEKSIHYRLRSDIEVGALLSGGLDSSALVTLCMKDLNRVGKKQFNTFTSYYPNNKECDETYFAHLINESCGCQENFISPQVKNVEKEFEDIVWHMEGFSGFATLGSLKVIEAAAKKGIHVILNGQGGDETLFGYERYYAFYLLDLLKKFKFKKFIREFKKISHCSKLKKIDLFKFFIYFNFPCIRNGRNFFITRKYLKKDIFKKFQYSTVKKYLYPKNLDELQYNELKHGQLTHILRMDDRGYMAYSVESRVPFLDYQFVETAVSIPPEEKINAGFTKILLRQYMDDKMPKEVTWRKNKLGFAAPIEEFVEHFNEEYIKDLLKTARSNKYFNTKYLLKNYEKIKTSRAMSDFLTVEIFMRKFEVIEDD